MKNKKVLLVIGILIATAFIVHYLPLLIIAGIIYFLYKKRKATPPATTPLPVIEQPTIEPSVIQGAISECQKLIDEHDNVIRETDIRQFKGRNDVTKEELAQYMFEQRYWDGAYERRLQMEEIIKHCNLTEADIQWCEQELKHYTVNGQTYTTMSVRSDEQKAIWEEKNRIGRDDTYKALRTMEQEYQESLKFDERMGITKVKGYEQFKETIKARHEENIKAVEDTLRTYDYDAWLRLRGYVDEHKENV